MERETESHCVHAVGRTAKQEQERRQRVQAKETKIGREGEQERKIQGGWEAKENTAKWQGYNE